MLRLWKSIIAIWLVVGVFSWQPAGAQSIPEKAYIAGFQGHPQTFNLSCESRSASDWAAFFGFQIGERKFLNHLPRSDNPEAGFVGDPNGTWGFTPPYSYGVHAAPVVALLRQYGLPAEARKGMSWEEVRAEIAAGRPVIIWVIGGMWPGETVRYTPRNGQTTQVASFEHTMVLVGYDSQRVQVVDASTGLEQVYSKAAFMASWSVLGNMAVVYVPISAPQPGRAQTVASPAAAPAANPAPAAPVETYKVKRGDYLIVLAEKLGVSWQDLAALNQLQPPYTLHAGLVLRLPRRAQVTANQPAPAPTPVRIERNKDPDDAAYFRRPALHLKIYLAFVSRQVELHPDAASQH
jgi:uncharacterized protein YvpB